MKRLLLLIVFFNVTLLISVLDTSNLYSADSDGMRLCEAVTLQDAASVLAVNPEDLKFANRELMVSPEDLKNKLYISAPCLCSIRSTSDFSKSINYMTYIFSDAKMAKTEFEKMLNNYETVAKVDMVEKTGDSAFRVEDQRFQRTVVVKDEVLIDVLNPTDFASQMRIIRLVMDIR